MNEGNEYVPPVPDVWGFDWWAFGGTALLVGGIGLSLAGLWWSRP